MSSVNSPKGDVGLDRSVNTVDASETTNTTSDNHSYNSYSDSSVRDSHNVVNVANKESHRNVHKTIINSPWAVVVVAVVAIAAVVVTVIYLVRPPAIPGQPGGASASVGGATASGGSQQAVASPPPSGPTSGPVAVPPVSAGPPVSAPVVSPPKPTTVISASAPAPANFVNRGNFNPNAPAVLIWGGSGDQGNDLSQRVASALKGTDGLFQDAFVKSGLFARASAGDAGVLRDLGLSGAASLIVLGRRMVKVGPQRVEGQDMFRAEGTVEVWVFDPANGYRSEGFRADTVKPGFSESEALKLADEALAEQISARLRGR